jgi:hypothetical protein
MWPLRRRPPAPEGRQIGTPAPIPDSPTRANRSSNPVSGYRIGEDVGTVPAGDQSSIRIEDSYRPPSWRELLGGLFPLGRPDVVDLDAYAWAAPKEPTRIWHGGRPYTSQADLDASQRPEDAREAWERQHAEDVFGQPRLISGPLGVMGRDWVLDPGQEA